MAPSQLRYGKNEQLRRIAQEVIVDQQQEIEAMHLALGQPLPVSRLSEATDCGSWCRVTVLLCRFAISRLQIAVVTLNRAFDNLAGMG